MAPDINPLFLAQSRLRRRRFDDCIEICTDMLQKNALDQQAWYLKVRALTLRDWTDQTELEEQGGHLLHSTLMPLCLPCASLLVIASVGQPHRQLSFRVERELARRHLEISGGAPRHRQAPDDTRRRQPASNHVAQCKP